MSIYHSDKQRWKAISTRDADADGCFVYAVITTGVVCYPSCPSRAALPENVRYYSDSTAAIADGFRYCRRCRTDLPPLAIRQRELVVKACRLIDESDVSPRIDALASALAVSRYHLQKLFKAHVGVSPKIYAQAIRDSKLRQALDIQNSVTQALHEAGYASQGSFYADVQKRLGMKVTQLRQGSEGVSIRYAFAQSPFGLIVVAETLKGICCVLFGDTRKALTSELEMRFPQAVLHHDKVGMQSSLEVVVQQITLPDASVEIPLDIQGTAFQEKVWRALQKIERGQRASYAEVAKAIGQPTAARAVATACAANPVAVLVPCHRVVRGDGSLSGYRWGVERKQRLLDSESDT